MRGVRAIVVAVGLAVAAEVTAKEIFERPWIEVRSEHFVIKSGLSEEQTRELATDLEHYRAAIDLMTRAGHVEEPIPTKIYLLPRAERALGFDGKILGYFHAGMRANYAVMIPAQDDNDETLKHEYTHYLVRNRDQRRY